MPVKKVQYCAFCKNHNVTSPKKGHHCSFRNCPCLLCDLTRKAQKAMRHQQRFWRHQKNRLKEHIDDPNFRVDPGLIDSEGQLRGQVCDKCRNHNHLTRKKNHNCPYINCDCSLCSLTFKRRQVMKHQQRVRRSKITTKIAFESPERSPPSSSSRPIDNRTSAWEEQNTNNQLYTPMNGIKPKENIELLLSENQHRGSSFSSHQKSPIKPISPTVVVDMEVDDSHITENHNNKSSSSHDHLRDSPPPLIPLCYSPFERLEDEFHGLSSTAFNAQNKCTVSDNTQNKCTAFDSTQERRYSSKSDVTFCRNESMRENFEDSQLHSFIQVEKNIKNCIEIKQTFFPPLPAPPTVFQAATMNMKNILSIYRTEDLDFSEFICNETICNGEDSADDTWECSGCSSSNESEQDLSFERHKDETSKAFLYRC